MLRVHIRPHWEIAFEDGEPIDMGALIALLLAIQETGSIAQGAKRVKLSYRYAWGILREAAQRFGAPLVEAGRGRGAVLTPLGDKLAWADRRIAARLSPTLDSLASELESELVKMTAERPRVLRMFASHGFAVAALMEGLNKDTVPVELSYRNSTDAVSALARGECDLAGFHVPLGRFQARVAEWYAQWLDPQQHCLLHLTHRMQGLIVARGNPRKIRKLADLTRPGVRFVNRQVGSGTRMLLELMLDDAGIPRDDISGIGSTEFTHSAVAAYIASGMGDVGFGVQTAAERFGLDFIPLVRERYFFGIRREDVDDALFQQLIAILRLPAYHRTVNALAGYSAAQTGRILSLEAAFKSRAA